MPIKQLIIHAGYPKAGSTSIQETMYRHQEKLNLKNLYYPHSPLWKSNHGKPLSILFADDLFQLFDEKMLKLFELGGSLLYRNNSVF